MQAVSTSGRLRSFTGFWSWILSILSNHRIIDKTPIVTTLLFETANIGHVFRMWTEKTAAGQSLTSWILVNLGLLAWYNWYRVFTPEQVWAKRTTLFGVTINTFVILSIAYFRFVGG